MLTVHVFVDVKPDCVEIFKKATIENASNSLKEPGIERFDVVQQMDDITKFVLVEVYKSSEDLTRHMKTTHYKKWYDSVADMMESPRSNKKYTNIYPIE